MEAGYGNLMSKINHLKEEIEADQVVKIMEKLNKNQKKVQRHIHGGLSETFEVNPSLVNNVSFEVPRLGIESSLCIVNRFLPDSADNAINVHEVIFAKSIKLPKIQRIPTYTTWIFLDRSDTNCRHAHLWSDTIKTNQRMAENQTVVGRRRIYYDGDEALVCSDSEDDFPEIEEEKHDFSDVEDRFLWMAFQEHGSDDDVATVVSHFIEASPVEIQERYKEIKLKFELSQEKDSPGTNMFLEKSLGASLDSFDNLFCRRCLVFDCRLHGCSQNLIYPSEKQLNWSGFEDMKPCSDQCYLLVRRTTEKLVEGSDSSLHHMDHVIVEGENRDSSIFNFDVNVSSADVDISCSSKSAAGEGSTAELLLASTVVPVIHTNSAKRKISDDNDRELEEPGSFENSIDKKRMKILAIEPTTVTGETPSAKATSSDVIKTFSVDPCQYMDHQLTCKRPLLGHTTNIFNDVSSQNILSSQPNDILVGEVHDINRKIEQKLPSVFVGSQSRRLQSSCEWKSLENDLFLKGLEIFGRNSCLITRNLLSGLKTCNEVYNYMRNNRALMTHKMNTVHSSEDNAGVGSDNLTQEILMRSRSRLIRKRGKTRRLKYSTKSNGHPSSWKRVGDADQSCKQYTPCACKFMCGKDCSCLKKGTYCEKYCGCSKDCKSRFRGCQCAKSQCRSRQCPCYAANRECDPDVCRNCWVSCGGGSLGEPPKRGDGQCGNMRLLLRQQQRILLGRSKVAGWGAFIKNSVNKHDYLGEYTGELISHREADKRGKTYDRSNSSFLFDLNDEYVLDACRQGDKLKFANHSSKPNCYCRIIMVAGDHRVGIFAKERIEALDELFYDYRYGPNEAPAWARPGASKKGDFLPSQSRARKHQSR